MSKSPTQTIMRSGLGRARGLGSAKTGAAHWFAERATGLALVPLTLWFIYSVLSLLGAPRAAVVAWGGHTVNATLLLALVLIMFHHMSMGLQVVMEDYIHSEKRRLVSVLLMKAVVGLFGLAATLAIIKLALVG
ncbi:MAG: succinate dehydrogenase, hydrophobic membrane anchor protein [Acetobacteraceae bacterium]|nr:succinate dehydrogenase, hydrophobic membrane anchor protein [Acetobacteraceae bacterium]